MTTLEKTISLLNKMPEHQLEQVYSYVLLVNVDKPHKAATHNINAILERLCGIAPNSGRTLEDYRNERLRERYGLTG